MNKLLTLISTVMLGYTAMSADALNIAFRDIEIMSDNVTTNVLFQGLATKDDVDGKIDRVLPDGRVFFEDSQAWEVVAESVPGCEIIVEVPPAEETPDTGENTEGTEGTDENVPVVQALPVSELTATLNITNYNDIVGAFVIPDRVKVNDTYHKVVAITTNVPSEGREQNFTVTSVEGGKHCTTLGEGAFFRCSAITNISLPSVTRLEYGSLYLESGNDVSMSLPKVQYVGEYAIAYIPGITSISLPEVTTIAPSGVYYCERLQKLYLPKVESLDISAFLVTQINELTLGAYATATITDNYPWGLSSGRDLTINVPREYYNSWSNWAHWTTDRTITINTPAGMADLGSGDSLTAEKTRPGETILKLTQSNSDPATVSLDVEMTYQEGSPRSFTFPMESGMFATTNYVDAAVASVDVSAQIAPLQEAVESLQTTKQDKLEAGYGIKITDNLIALADADSFTFQSSNANNNGAGAGYYGSINNITKRTDGNISLHTVHMMRRSNANSANDGKTVYMRLMLFRDGGWVIGSQSTNSVTMNSVGYGVWLGPWHLVPTSEEYRYFNAGENIRIQFVTSTSDAASTFTTVGARTTQDYGGFLGDNGTTIYSGFAPMFTLAYDMTYATRKYVDDTLSTYATTNYVNEAVAGAATSDSVKAWVKAQGADDDGNITHSNLNTHGTTVSDNTYVKENGSIAITKQAITDSGSTLASLQGTVETSGSAHISANTFTTNNVTVPFSTVRARNINNSTGKISQAALYARATGEASLLLADTTGSATITPAGYNALTNQVYGSNVIFDIEGYEAGTANNTTELRIYEKAADGSRSKVYFSNDAIVAATNELAATVSDLVENYANTNFVMGVYNYEGDPTSSELRVSKLNAQGTYDVVYSSTGNSGELASTNYVNEAIRDIPGVDYAQDLEEAVEASCDVIVPVNPDATLDGYIGSDSGYAGGYAVVDSVASGSACGSSTVVVVIERADNFASPTAQFNLVRYGQFDRGSDYVYLNAGDSGTELYVGTPGSIRVPFGVGKHLVIMRYRRIAPTQTVKSVYLDGEFSAEQAVNGMNGLNIWVGGASATYTGLTFTTYVYEDALTDVEIDTINYLFKNGITDYTQASLASKTAYTLNRTRSTEESLQRQIDALSELHTEKEEVESVQTAMYLRAGEWVATYEPAVTSNVTTNDISEVYNNHTITQHEIISQTGGKALMKGFPISYDVSEVNLVSAESVSGDAVIEGLTISASADGSYNPVIRVTDASGVSKTCMVALSQSTESKKTQRVYTADNAATFRKHLNDEALLYTLRAAGDETVQRTGSYRGTTTYDVGVNSFYTTGEAAWNPGCYIPPSLCSIISFKTADSSFAQGYQWTNTGGGPCFVVGKRLMANANHFGGTTGVHTRKLMRPNGTVVTVETTGSSWRLSDWVKDNYGDSAEELLGADPSWYSDIQIYETSTDIPDDCIPYLLPYDVATNHFTVAENGALELGVAGFALTQINSVIPVGATADRSYRRLPSSWTEYFREDICNASANFKAWGVVSGDSGHPAFFSMSATPVIIGLWTYPDMGPSFIRATRAIEALETANGRDPATSLKVLTETQIQSYISQ